MSTHTSRAKTAIDRLPSRLRARLAAGATCATLAVSPAAAGNRTVAPGRDGAASDHLYALPNVVRLTPGMVRLLRPRCDPDYPMDEAMPCGSVTGGPVGGRGS